MFGCGRVVQPPRPNLDWPTDACYIVVAIEWRWNSQHRAQEYRLSSPAAGKTCYESAQGSHPLPNITIDCRGK
jgi:hypothetical protein